MAILYILFFFCVINHINAQAYGFQPCRIAFRMDDVQDDFLVDVQKEVIDKFVTAGVPLTLGVIGNSMGIGSNEMAPFINTRFATAGDKLEIASHSPAHFTMRGLSLAVQEEQLSSINFKFFGPGSLLPANPFRVLTVIPPYNQFDANTLTAMKNTGYTTLTASAEPGHVTIGPINYYLNCATSSGLVEGIYHWPQGATTWDIETQLPIPAAQTIQQIKDQMPLCGNFSVVMMHFSEFADNSTKQRNDTAMLQLQAVIDSAKASGCELRTLRAMAGEVPPSVNVFPTPAPSNPQTSPNKAPSKGPTSSGNALAPTFLVVLLFAIYSLPL